MTYDSGIACLLDDLDDGIDVRLGLWIKGGWDQGCAGALQVSSPLLQYALKLALLQTGALDGSLRVCGVGAEEGRLGW